MRLSDFGFATSIALQLLCASTGSAGAQSDSLRTPSPQHRSPSVAVWATLGMGAAKFTGKSVESIFPPTLAEGWLTVGPVAVGLSRVDAGAGINTTERVERSWLLGARSNFGPLMLVVGAGKATVIGRNSNGEQSGTTTPIEEARGWTAHGQLSCALGRYFGFGVMKFLTGGTRARSSGTFVVVHVGRLR